MRSKAQSGKKSVQPGKQVAIVVPHDHGTQRKKSHARRNLVPQRNAKRSVQRRFLSLSPQELLAKAIGKGDINTVERLLQMRRELQAEAAKQQYMQALARFQRICPVIPKTKLVRFETKKGGIVNYRYAPLDVIIAYSHKPLADCDFSYMIKGEQDKEQFTAIVEGYHVGGHCETSRFSVPIVLTEYMSAPQSVASAQMFAKRQAFCNLWGIVTTDTDDDARSAGITTPNGAKAEIPAQRTPPAALPENPGIDNIEKLLKQMPWLPADTSTMYRKQAKNYVERKDNTSLRGLAQSLSKQIAMKGREKK